MDPRRLWLCIQYIHVLQENISFDGIEHIWIPLRSVGVVPEWSFFRDTSANDPRNVGAGKCDRSFTMIIFKVSAGVFLTPVKSTGQWHLLLSAWKEKKKMLLQSHVGYTAFFHARKKYKFLRESRASQHQVFGSNCGKLITKKNWDLSGSWQCPHTILGSVRPLFCFQQTVWSSTLPGMFQHPTSIYVAVPGLSS